VKTLVAYPNTDAQFKAIKAVFEAMEIPYNEESELDETEQILANPAMVKHLNESMRELKEGKTTKVSLDNMTTYDR
jgi:hypothetical protein